MSDAPAQDLQRKVPGRPFQEGEDDRRNKGGRPKGACPRAAWLRQIAADANDHGEGKIAAQYAHDYLTLSLELRGATAEQAGTIREKMHALEELFAQAEGRPTNFNADGEHTDDPPRILRTPPPPQVLPDGS